MTNVANIIRAEIGKLEKQVEALRQALSAVASGPASKASPVAKGRRKRRAKTAAEKKVLSQKLKAAWRRRKSSQKASPAKKSSASDGSTPTRKA